MTDFLGVYQGTFGGARTDDPGDDINYNPCDAGRERCLGGDQPLVDVVLELRRDEDGAIRLGFYRSLEAHARGDQIDLLGRGCATTIGPMAGLSSNGDNGRRYAAFPLTAGNRLCLNKLRPTSAHVIRLELGIEPDTGARFLQVLIDKDVTTANYLYVTEEGKQRRVRIDLDNTLTSGAARRYRVCIEDDLGDYSRCVLTDREAKRFVLPVPLPGGAALSYTWWEELTPKLRRTQGLYEVEQYSARFQRAD